MKGLSPSQAITLAAAPLSFYPTNTKSISFKNTKSVIPYVEKKQYLVLIIYSPKTKIITIFISLTSSLINPFTSLSIPPKEFILINNVIYLPAPIESIPGQGKIIPYSPPSTSLIIFKNYFYFIYNLI